MTSDEAISAIGALEGQDVEVRVYGIEEGHGPIATLAGALDGPSSADTDLLSELTDITGGPVLGNPIPHFTVGANPANIVELDPDRFVSASATDSPRGVEVVTKDAVIHFTIPRPWID